MGVKRAIVVVKGEVQRIGYRDFVERISRKLGITGFVENLKPYDVKIICEGEEEKIKKFLEMIKNPPKPAEVEDIKINFEEPKKEFEYFEIRRGEPMEELGERMDVAGKVLYEVRDLQKETLGLQKETVNGIGVISNGIAGINTGINTIGNKFDNLDMKYGKIAENMEKILIEFQKDRKESRTETKELIQSILKLAERGQEKSS